MQCMHFQGDVALDVGEDASFVQRVPMDGCVFLGERYGRPGYPYLSEEVLVVAVLVVVVDENLDDLAGECAGIPDAEHQLLVP